MLDSVVLGRVESEMLRSTLISHLLAGSVGALLAYAGARKIIGRREWVAAARRQHLAPIVVVLVPPTELVLGSAMVGLGPQVWSLAGATLLLLVFTAFLVAQIAAGSSVPCACFGNAIARPPRWRDVGRNAALIGALLVAAALA